jgi:hypothetical protein
MWGSFFPTGRQDGDQIHIQRTPEVLKSQDGIKAYMSQQQKMQLPNSTTGHMIEAGAKNAAVAKMQAWKAGEASRTILDRVNSGLTLLQVQASHASAMARASQRFTQITGEHAITMRQASITGQSQKNYYEGAFQELDRTTMEISSDLNA